MKKALHKAVAIVGMGAVMPDAPDKISFWNNIKQGKYSIAEVPENRWDVHKYYDPDRKAPDKTYSKIGGWVKEDGWDPMKWRLPIPPKVAAQMDYTQKWAITAAREALLDFGYPDKDFDKDRTAVILGVAMGGDQHLYSAARIFFPEYAEMLTDSAGFATLPADTRKKILGEMYQNLDKFYPGITEDTMPGELSNIVAGRIAALYNFHGPNYIADAACASAMAGISAAIEGLEEYDFDLVVTGGIDANMSPTTFVKFCKIGALSATGTRPYAEGADGFVMGEGGAVFVLKRLEDAERDGDKIYAVIRSLGGSSDGKGKGITAPNPIGQKLAVKRGWENAGLSPASATLIEGHGTSTSVGDAAELQCLHEVYKEFDLPVGSIALGSVKSNIGHLKGAAGAAGIFKAAMALHERVLPPSLNFHKPNPGVDFNTSPFAVNTQLRPWEMKNGDPRRAGVSAFGFGGTNFHAVLEEYIPGKILSEQKTQVSMAETHPLTGSPQDLKAPLRGAFVKGGGSLNELVSKLEAVLPKIEGGWTPELKAPAKTDLQAAFRIAIDYGDSTELADKVARAIKGIKAGKPGVWKPLNAKGIFLGQGPAPKIAFTFTGQGSQYVNMLSELRATEPIIAETFREADEVMKPLLGRPLTDFIFVDENDKTAINEADEKLKQTEITQPAVLTTDIALYRLMKAYGIDPDFVIGHSLGEYGALVASGAVSFKNALEAVSARGTQMAKVQVDDKGIMAAVFGSPEQINEIIGKVNGYVEIANINSYGQSVIGGATEPVLEAMAICKEAGLHVAQLPVSHAFHTAIVAPASGPLGEVLATFGLKAPVVPIIANVTGDFYPTDGDVEKKMIDILSRQVASPVQFVKGINKLYDSGARVFIEMGPKKALNGFVRDIMSEKEDVMNLFTNHPKVGDIVSFNHGLCGAYASGLGFGEIEKAIPANQEPFVVQARVSTEDVSSTPVMSTPPVPAATNVAGSDRYEKLGRLFVDFMDKANAVYGGRESVRQEQDIWITGAAVGLPGVDKVFQDSNVASLLRGDQFIGKIPDEFQQEMLEKNITRLVKTGKGGPRFETISQVDEVIKLAARKVNLDIVRDFGFPQSRKAAIDTMTELAIGAGIDALRDAGIPLVMHYKDTTTGSKLPDRWLLPDSMKDDTGIIFASAFPGYNAYAKEMGDFYKHRALEEKLALLKHIRGSMSTQNGNTGLTAEIDQRIRTIQQEMDAKPYNFNRRFLLRVLAMGHSQFAEYIGARGPNTQINSACASTTMAVGLSKDWIEAGRCKRVIIIAGDDITSDDTIAWFSSGFLAVGAAATDEKVEDAALPFDKRRHGMLVGMGGVAIIVESGDSARNRGINPICEVLGTTIANSAFHGTRLDVDHIRMVMEDMIAKAEKKWGIDRHRIASEMVFISHETYTPARGGSASAEINALRYVFGDSADKIVIANTKGMTGHAMAVGIEDVLAIKSLETGLVPPVPNFKVIDPELGALNLSKGGAYPVRYALRLGAGFGSQVSMSLLRWTPVAENVRRAPDQLGYEYRIADQQRWNEWLKEIGNKANPEMEVFKRTLRIKDPLADKLTDVEEVPQVIPQTVNPAPVPPTPATTISAEAPSEAEENPVKTKILNLIAEKTGYPVDMLNPELDLEADLGIDTVKQAELFADIRSEYGIERDDSIQLSEFPTLNHIIQFVFDKRPDLAKLAVAQPVTRAAGTPPVATADEPVQSAGNAVMDKVINLIAEKTGYPADMLDPELDLEADLGIDTVKQAELFAEIRGEYGIERDDSMQLSEFPTLQHIVQFVFDKRPDLKETVTATTAPVVTPVSATVLPAPVNADAGSAVLEKITTLIAEKTGYPADMLDPELDLEADLGIDTVKQAELFAEIRGEYGIERDDALQLSEFPTLQHIVQFVFDKRPDLKEGAAAPTMVAAAVPEVAVVSEMPAVAQTGNEVLEKVTQLIAEKTGYPADMLDPELDLEADLGIDTVKQAELFAEIRGEYGIERDDALQLSEFPTLNHIVQFVYDRRPDLQHLMTTSVSEPVQEPVTSAPVTSVPESTGNEVLEKVVALIAEKTGYPADMLDPDLDLEADLGIDTVKQAELFAEIRGEYGIERDDNLELSAFPTLNHIVQFVFDRRPDLKQAAIPEAPPVMTESAPAQTSRVSDDGVLEKVVALIAEKTGYPADMLDPELDLEADLGIDTVKQAELFAEIRTEYGIERDDNLELSEFPTLNHIVQFVYDRRPAQQVEDTVTGAASKSEHDVSETSLVQGDIDTVDSIPRRIPVPQLRPDLRYCKPSGVQLDENSHIIVVADQGGVGKALAAQLQKTGAKVQLVEDVPEPAALAKRLADWNEKSPVTGVYWLPALDSVGDISQLKYKEWKAATYQRVKLLYHTMRELVMMGNKNVFLVSGTRMGGNFGYDDAGALAPLGGAVSGFTKAYKREHPEAQVKVVDFEKSRKTKAFAEILVAETLNDTGVVEVGYKEGGRWTIGLEVHPPLEGQEGMQLSKDSNFLITGAAGSITSAITADLAKASGGTFYLMDLTPEPDPQNPDILQFAEDKEGLKRDIFNRLKAAGEKATPVIVDKELAAIERSYSALAAIQAVEKAGGTAHYYSVNLLDNKAVAKAVKAIKSKAEKIDVLLHAGGLEISRLLPDKSPQEFELVFDVKADGWYNLLSSFGDYPIGATVVFSSIAGRFGNGGQTDYSSANDFLCKSSSSFRTLRKGTRGIALDWTAWGGIGMAARGSIPTVMKQAGIDMLPPEAGIPFIRKELTAGTQGLEVVVAQSLGMMMQEFDATGGLDTTEDSEVAQLVQKANGVMIREVKTMGLYSGLVTKATFDPKQQGFLFDHEINSTPVLPGVMGVEAMTEAAKILFPDKFVNVVESVEFMAPFKFYRSDPRDVMVKVFFKMEGKDVIAHCELFGERQLLGQEAPEVKTHFKAEIRLTDKPLKGLKPLKRNLTPSSKQVQVGGEDIYQLYFHGPAYQVIEQSWKDKDEVIGLYASNLPANHDPEALNTLAMPRLIELCFQTAGLWEMGAKASMGLPARMDTLKIYKYPGNSRTRLFALVENNGETYNARVVDKKGEIYLALTGYATVELPSAMDNKLLEPIKKAMK